MRRSLIVMAGLGVLTAAGATAAVVRAPSVEVAQERERRGPDSAQVARFLGALRAADPMLCELISDQIGNFWSDDGGIGVGRLADVRVQLRAQRYEVSSEVRDAAAIALLGSELGGADPCVRHVAAKMLGNSAVTDDALARYLGDPSPRLREAALRAAGQDDRLALRVRVERLLEGDDAAVSAMAAWALGEYELRPSVAPLRRALRHDAAAVRAAAAWALGNIEDVSVVADLETLVARDSDRRVRLAAIRALGNLEQPRSVTVLAPLVEGSDRGLAIAAIEAISSLDELSVPPASVVRAAASSDREVMLAALDALTDFEDESLAPVFLAHIIDSDPEVRAAMIEALGELGARSAVSAITRALRDPDADVRRAAIEALAEIDDR